MAPLAGAFADRWWRKRALLVGALAFDGFCFLALAAPVPFWGFLAIRFVEGCAHITALSVLLMLAFGFVISLIISWAYEITPDGIKRERDVVRDDSITHITAKKLDYITLAAVVGVAFVYLWPRDDAATGTKTCFLPTAFTMTC